MYPNLYYVFKDWFGVEWSALSFLNTFGLMVAVSFLIAAILLTKELKRKEKQGLLHPVEEWVIIGKPASLKELLLNFLLGFAFGYKLLGLFLSKPATISAQEYIFSGQGSFIAGIVAGGIMAWMKWREKEKQKQKEPEQKKVWIWPHDRVGDIVVLALVGGIVGAKFFDNLENWNDFIQHPIARMFSASGLTFYGGLIVATAMIIGYARKKKIGIIHLADAIAPSLMIAYAIGRIGCQVAGDGDWGIYNSAYITAPDAKVVAVTSEEYQQQLDKYHTYFLDGTVLDSGSAIPEIVTDRKSSSLEEVPHKHFKAPSFLPVWMVAYNYPKNVNKDGFIIPGDTDEHNRVLPVPVFPTPFYEIVACTLLFILLWSIRKRTEIPGALFSIYLILNGLERFFIEKIRVNNKYHLFGFSPTQAELISFALIIAGCIMFFLCKKRQRRSLAKPV